MPQHYPLRETSHRPSPNGRLTTPEKAILKSDRIDLRVIFLILKYSAVKPFSSTASKAKLEEFLTQSIFAASAFFRHNPKMCIIQLA